MAFSWEKLQKNLQPGIISKEKKNYRDERFWKIGRDANGNGAAIIRLVPDKNEIPFVQIYHYSLRKVDSYGERYLIVDSPSTINLPCPISKKWAELYNTGRKEEAKQYARKIKYIANILVIKDPSNPENEGKIFLWEFGTVLKDKFLSVLNPSEQARELGEEPKELFSLLEDGCSIKLKIKKSAGFYNYDDTEIMSPSAIVKTEEEERKIIEKTYDLSEFLNPNHYLSYEELESRLKYFETGIRDFDSEVKMSKINSEEKETKIDESEKIKKSSSTTINNKNVIKEIEEDDDDLSFIDDLI